MTRRNLIVLAAIVAGLLLVLTISERLGRGTADSARTLLLEDFADHANDIRQIDILFPADTPGIAIRREDTAWHISTRDDYPADISKLAQLVTALAEAEIVERATANPDRYGLIGIDDPGKGGSGTRLSVIGEGFDYELVVGKDAQRTYQYVRLAGEESGYLVNRKIELPQDASDWMPAGIIDIPSERVRRVSISHADGELLVIEKAARDDSNFTVLDIPDSRELSYPTIGNGIAGALSDLELEDVRRSAEGDAQASSVFETWSGLHITVDVTAQDDTSWLSFSAEAPGENGEPEAVSEAAEINERLGGWQYAVADYKKNLIVRRWDDILADE